MTTHRAYLPIHEPKCSALAMPCSRAQHCARHQVAHERGRPAADWTAGYAWTAENCHGYLSIDFHGHAAPKKVHGPIRGIC